MKLWEKIFLSSFISSVSMFFLCGFIVSVMNLHFVLTHETERSQYYQGMYSRRVQEVLAAQGDAGSYRYLDSVEQDLAGDGQYLKLERNGELVYDAFQKAPPEPRYDFGSLQASYTPSYMKDIGDSRFLFVESEFGVAADAYKLVLVTDLSRIYASCDTQLNIFGVLCLVQAVLVGLIMLLSSRSITRPIEVLSAATKIVANESYAFRIPVEGENEISELSTNFNLMAQAIEVNIESYKQVIGNLTHEIKTPLTSIIGYAQLLKSGQCGSQMQDQALGYILSEGKRLNSLTKKMIHLSRIQPSLLDVTYEKVKDLLEICLMAVRMKAKDKRVAVAGICGDEIFCYVDRELMITMLENLLDNAIKASPPGETILIEVSDEARALSYLTVTDHGVGIPQADIAKIEQPFYTVDKSRSKAEDGFGMGLAICKSVMQQHGGTLRFESEVGRFTRATAEFPAERYHRILRGSEVEVAPKAVDNPDESSGLHGLNLMHI